MFHPYVATTKLTCALVNARAGNVLIVKYGAVLCGPYATVQPAHEPFAQTVATFTNATKSSLPGHTTCSWATGLSTMFPSIPHGNAIACCFVLFSFRRCQWAREDGLKMRLGFLSGMRENFTLQGIVRYCSIYQRWRLVGSNAQTLNPQE